MGVRASLGAILHSMNWNAPLASYAVGTVSVLECACVHACLFLSVWVCVGVGR